MTQRFPQSPPDPDPLDPNRKEIKALQRLFKRRPLTLADYFAIGEQMHRLRESGDIDVGYRSGWRRQVARVLGQTSPSTLTKCLQFFTSYKRKEVARLERLGVGWIQLIIALGIHDRKQRHELLRRAREEQWGQRELQREARRIRGTYRGGGRKRKEVKSRGCLADVSELVRRTAQWIAFHDQAWKGNEKTYVTEIDRLSDEARVSLTRVLSDAEEVLQVLQRQCQSVLKTVQALQKKLPGAK